MCYQGRAVVNWSGLRPFQASQAARPEKTSCSTPTQSTYTKVQVHSHLLLCPLSNLLLLSRLLLLFSRLALSGFLLRLYWLLLLYSLLLFLFNLLFVINLLLLLHLLTNLDLHTENILPSTLSHHPQHRLEIFFRHQSLANKNVTIPPFRRPLDDDLFRRFSHVFAAVLVQVIAGVRGGGDHALDLRGQLGEFEARVYEDDCGC
jgi:hypothetical protein